jgi:hypothetical protein
VRAQRGIPCASEEYNWGVINPMENQQRMMAQRREEKERPENKEEVFGRGRRDFVPMTNWGQGNIDPDMVKKHKELCDRQYFMGPHWRAKPKPLIYEDLSMEEQFSAHFAPQPKAPTKVNKRF